MKTGKMIEMRGIVKRYYEGQANELEILHGIDLLVAKGEFLSIVGESGSGKSTLMNMIGILDRPTEGSYLLDGQEVSNLSEISAVLLNYSPGDQITLTLYRMSDSGQQSGSEFDITITLLEDKGETQSTG